MTGFKGGNLVLSPEIAWCFLLLLIPSLCPPSWKISYLRGFGLSGVGVHR